MSYLGGTRGKGAVIAQSNSKDIVKELKDDDFPPTLLAVAEVHGPRDCGSWRGSLSKGPRLSRLGVIRWARRATTRPSLPPILHP